VAKRAGRVRSHSAVAWCYDEIAALYSLGRIARAKASQVRLLEAGECVLYAGVGRGEEALLAARSGVRVTALDASGAMLARFRRALTSKRAQAELVCGDLFGHAPAQPYDTVVANFFLNVFSPDEMRRALSHLVSLVRPGGRLMIADFAPPRGSAAARLMCRAYYRPVSLAAFACRLAALHPIYDYALEFEKLGLALIRRDEFRLAERTPVFFESLVARRC
jgi:ubiquinone/menaquinone biosynthesis C-methylase UbiE